MGGKGGKAPAPPPVTKSPEPDLGPMLAMMQQMIGVMGQQQPLPPQLPPLPEIQKVIPIDFGERIEGLRERMSASFNAAQSKQKGRSDTVLTSSLLDEEDDVTTNSSLLSGST